MAQGKGQPSKAQPGKAQPAKAAASKLPPPPRKPGKSIVNQKQTPWGFIAITAAIVLFAAGLITYAVMSKDSKNTPTGDMITGPSKSAPAASASKEQILKDLPGITVRTITDRTHVDGVVDYGADSPPFGGNHNSNWAQCTGVVYTKQLANENVVHTLEHGGVWVAYNPDLDSKSVDKLKSKVLGYNYMLMTPYQGLKKPIALQAWGYQMFFDSADDPKIDTFIKDLRLNPNTTPENGASCDNPVFKAADSYPGHPAAANSGM